MRSPVTAVTDHIVWPRHGPPWAVWRVTPRRWLHTNEADQVATLDDARAAFGRLRSSALLAGMCEPLSEREWARRTGAPPPPRAQRSAAVLVGPDGTPQPDGAPTWERGYWFAAAIDERPNRIERWTAPFRAAAADARVGFAVPVEQTVRAFTAAHALFTSAFNDSSVRPATAAEVMWWLDRTMTRGEEDKPVDWWDGSPFGRSRDHDGYQWTEFSSGALAGMFDRHVNGAPKPKRGEPVTRVVRVENSYQASLVVTATPDEWDIAPAQHTGGELFSNIEQLAQFPVDWFCRIEPDDNDRVMGKLRSLRRNMVEQYEQFDGDGQGANTPASITQAIADANQAEAELAPQAEPGLPSLILFTVAASNLTVVEDRARQVEALMTRYNVSTVRPLNGQLAALQAQWPTGQLPRIFNDYCQSGLTPLGLAGMAPFCGSVVGDPEGAPFAVNLDSGLRPAVLLGLAEQIRQADDDVDTTSSASMVIIGGLGAGKSYGGKTIGDIVIGRGGKFTTVDRTQRQEWVQFAEGLGPDIAEIVTLDGGSSVDPFACLPSAQAQQGAIGVLGSFLDVGPTSPAGALLASAVRATAGVLAHPRIRDVIALLHEWGEAGTDEAKDLARRLDVYALEPYCAPLFDRDRPGVNLDKRAVVFSLPGLTLPTEEQAKSEYMAKTTSAEQVWGKAITYLLSFLSRWVTFKDSTFALQIADEAWFMFSSPYGRQMLHEAVRDSRKHNNGIVILTHDLKEVPEETLDLVGSVMVGRVEGQSAKRAAVLFGDGESAAGVLSKLPKRRGVFLYRDAQGRTALIRVLRNDRLHEAMDTRPQAVPASDEGLLVG